MVKHSQLAGWRPLRFAVVGLGAFGEAYLACLSGLRAAAGAEIAAVCSRTASRAESLAAQYAVPRWYTDAAAVANDPEVDVVCVVTAEDEHRRPAVLALQAGKDVIVEKPLATTLEDADAILDAAAQSGRRLLVGHLLRSSPLYAALAARVHAGELGEIVSLHARRNRPGRLMAGYRRTHPVLETGIHDLDIMLWLAQSRVRRVRAYARTVHPGPTPDVVWGVLELESGALGIVETIWLAPEQGGLYTDDALAVFGSRGVARIDLSRAPLTVTTDAGPTVVDLFYETRIEGIVGGALREQLLYFISCVREGRQPDRVPLDEARHGLEVALALIRSAEEDREVVLGARNGLDA
jgi:UDP-N-acetylglucosamine 3-dehydrogenase